MSRNLPYDYFSTNCPILDLKNETGAYYIPGEVWVPVTDLVVKNICPYYLVSNYGRVYSAYSRRFLSENGDKDGYLSVTFRTKFDGMGSKDSCQVRKLVNRTVLISFNPINGFEQLEVNHIDGNKQNNCLSNLEWCTSHENKQHAVRTGLITGDKVRGENGPAAKLTSEQVMEISNLIRSTAMCYTEIARLYNVGPGVPRQIAYGETWDILPNAALSEEELRKCGRIRDKQIAYAGFHEEDLEKICSYLEYIYKNNITFKNKRELFLTVLKDLGLDEKYSYDRRRKTLVHLYYKDDPRFSWITDKYDYKFERKRGSTAIENDE